MMPIKGCGIIIPLTSIAVALCLLQAANYLNIKSLLDLTCLTVANMIKGTHGFPLLLSADSSAIRCFTEVAAELIEVLGAVQSNACKALATGLLCH